MYAFLSLILIFSTGLIACYKTSDNVRKKPALLGNFVYKGSWKMTMDSTYTVDTITGMTNRLFIDSTYDQKIAVVADGKTALFTIQPGTLTEQIMDHLAYSFPAEGPFFYAAHASPGMVYDFYFSADSLYFHYNRTSIMVDGFLMKIADFKGKRIK
jgi:hypothetical protein